MSEDDRICVLPGDIIGVHYPNKDGVGVVPYEDSGRPSTAGVPQDQLSRIFNQDIGDSSLPVGVEKTVVVNDLKRLIALEPVIGMH